ncbi:hypothetical protein COCON_G00043100 [Conger conger]|uniref:Immunoglobulin V-set domain-containing protein n=1 Tax=Conger conger TaxID=82655 RepID=A0A9Q1I4R9_CONCO|nr:hypothetical protein COCON_G00043100 [Conger conger]
MDSACRTRRNFSTLLLKPGQPTFRHKTQGSHESCVYNFPKRNLSLSDAGTYYCAVATCGEILFGNETKMDVEKGQAKIRTIKMKP